MRVPEYRVLVASFLTIVLGCVALAQEADVKLTLAYNVYVVGEPVLVQIECFNKTRDRIEIGPEHPGTAMFMEIKSSGSRYGDLESFNDTPMVKELNLSPGRTFRRKVELDKWFPLTEEGRYIAQFVMVHGGIRHISAKRSFDVVPGIAVKEGVQMFVDRANTRRHFRLVYWHRNQVDRLFLRAVDEPSGRIWDTVDLGNYLRLESPRFDISPDGEITVVQKVSQMGFIRTVLWSLPESLEVAERDNMLDPDVSASQRIKSLYEDSEQDREAEERERGKRSWWKLW